MWTGLGEKGKQTIILLTPKVYSFSPFHKAYSRKRSKLSEEGVGWGWSNACVHSYATLATSKGEKHECDDKSNKDQKKKKPPSFRS